MLSNHEPIADHYGQLRMYDTPKRIFCWPNMVVDVNGIDYKCTNANAVHKTMQSPAVDATWNIFQLPDPLSV